MQYKLIDKSERLCNEWAARFGRQPNVDVLQGDILEVPCDALVSPANSFGFMDGGLDLAISIRFGWDLQDRLQSIIRKRSMRELLVGEALVLETGHADVPTLVVAPTMRVPMSFGIGSSVNAYLAMKALLLAGKSAPGIQTIAIPGLCTGTGGMPPEVAAKQMFAAFEEVVLGKPRIFTGFHEAQRFQRFLSPGAPIYADEDGA